MRAAWFLAVGTLLGAVHPTPSTSTSTIPFFYVSSSNPNASDANSGQTPAAPWRTLQRAGQADLTAGASLFLAAGDSFQGGATLRVRGAAGAPVYIGAYSTNGTAPALLARPTIDGPMRRGGACLTLTGTAGTPGPSHLTVEGIAFTNAENGLVLQYTRPPALPNHNHAHAHTHTGDHGRTGPAHSSVSPAAAANVTVRGCFFHRIQWTDPYPQDINIVYGGGRAIALTSDPPLADTTTTATTTAATAVPLVEGVLLANNLATEVDMFYTNRVARVGLARGLNASVATRDVAVRGNCIANSSFNQVLMDDTTNMVVGGPNPGDGNVFLRNKPRIRFGWGTTDVIMGFLDATSGVVGNSFLQRGEHAGDPDGCAIDLESPCSGSVIANNTFYQATGAGVNVFGHFGATSTGLAVSHNHFNECGCRQGRPPYASSSSDIGAIAFDLPDGTGNISFNLVVPCRNRSIPLWGGPEANHAGFGFANNHIVTHGPVDLVVLPLPHLAFHGNGFSGWCGTPPGIYPTMHYTLDGSRPHPRSAKWPPPPTLRSELVRDTALLVRCFAPNFLPSPTNGLILEPPPPGDRASP